MSLFKVFFRVERRMCMKINRQEKHRSKLNSIKAPLYRVVITAVAICLGVSAVFMAQTSAIYSRFLNERNQKALASYAERLDRSLTELRDFSRSLTINNIQFRTLSQSNCSDQQRIVAEYYLRELIESRTPHYGISLLYHADTERALFYYGDDVQNDAAFLENAAFMHYLGKLISNTTDYVYDQWLFYSEGSHQMLLLVNKYRTMYFCAVVDLNCYFEVYPIESYSEMDETVVYSEEGPFIVPDNLKTKVVSNDVIENGGRSRLLNYAVNYAALDSCRLWIALFTPIQVFLTNQTSSIVLFLLVLAILIVFLKKILRSLDESLLFPLQEIAVQMAQLTGKEAPPPMVAKSDFEEYDVIRQALTELVQQKNELERLNYANQAQKEHAMLQYYQLQTRSHFFLNCLKSLYSMVEKSNRVQMQAMIIAFSNHLRYIFHDNLHLVTLQDELKEVMDYHRIITMDFPMPFLLSSNVPKDLMDASVPPLIIQTFLENTYKYAGRSQRVVTFQIDVSEADFHDRMYLRIHLSDNGGGYTEEVLESINNSQADLFADQHVGINNLRHRVSILYGGECHMAFYNENEGKGGAHSVIYIPLIRGQNGQEPGSSPEQMDSGG